MAQPDDLGDSYHGKLNSQLAALPHSSDKHLTRRELPHLRSENETNGGMCSMSTIISCGTPAGLIRAQGA